MEGGVAHGVWHFGYSQPRHVSTCGCTWGVGTQEGTNGAILEHLDGMKPGEHGKLAQEELVSIDNGGRLIAMCLINSLNVLVIH